MTQRIPPASRKQARHSPAFSRILRETSRLLDSGDTDKAQRILAGAMALAPSDLSVLKLEANIYLRQKLHGQALKVLDNIRKDHPLDAECLLWEARALAGMGRVEQAIATLVRLCELRPGVESWMELALMYDHHGDHQLALEFADRVLEWTPSHAQAGLLRARSLLALGSVVESARQFRHLIASNIESARSWFGLVDIKTVRLSGDEMELLQHAAGKQGLREADSLLLDFALGNALERAGNFAEAFAVLTRANEKAAWREPWSASAHRSLTTAIAVAFDEVSPSPASSSRGAEVIFLCGLPRSGSTLVEQVLASHSKVEGASELPDLPAVLAEESRRRSLPFEKWAALATEEDWARLGDAYLTRTERWRKRKPVSTDKNLENWKFIGAINKMLPGSRVVECRRDAVETCWSCYKQLFAQGLVPFSYRFEDLAGYWNDHVSLSNRWSRRYGDGLLIQQYESILENPEQAIRNLLAHCGLSFEAQCVSFQSTGRAIRTASSAQVREPLAAPPLRRQDYAALLEPLVGLLETRV
ncbi:MAG: sulfotransferase [Dokdonella sp.]|uniref:tetratricopeptide repeat-containing sulfotransferase family protein n=1 Tax=Dokdonella sp. TaxID=2291710 RepID=UPI003BAF7327